MPRIQVSRLGIVGLALAVANVVVSQESVPSQQRGAVAEIVFADGRREAVKEPRQDSKGRWTAIREGRRTPLKAGEVVLVRDEAGNESVTIPPLVTAADPPEIVAALASVRDPKNAAWLQAAEQLGAHPSQSVINALVALAADSRSDLRSRAITALVRMRTKESVTAATTAIVAERDVGLRRNAASALFSVQEIFKRCDAAKAVSTGMADKDQGVRIVFALLSPSDLAAATAVLRTDGIKHADHHFRESSALELGRRGDGAGESILIAMLSRTSLPGFDGSAALMERHLIREQVEICGILGKLGTTTANAALKKATASRREPVRQAAESALTSAAAK